MQGRAQRSGASPCLSCRRSRAGAAVPAAAFPTAARPLTPAPDAFGSMPHLPTTLKASSSASLCGQPVAAPRRVAARAAGRQALQVSAGTPPPPAWPGRVPVPETLAKQDGPKASWVGGDSRAGQGRPRCSAVGVQCVPLPTCQRRLLLPRGCGQPAALLLLLLRPGAALIVCRRPAPPPRRPPAEVQPAGQHGLHRHPDAGHCGGAPRQVPGGWLGGWVAGWRALESAGDWRLGA